MSKIKFSLTRVRLDKGGYTSSGYYFGNGLPLYWYSSEDNDPETGYLIEGYIRASTRANAKMQVRKICNTAVFYN